MTGTPIFMRTCVSLPGFFRTWALAVTLGLAGVAAACGGSPTGPGVLSSERRVQTGSGGGTTLPACSPEEFCSSVEVRAAGGTLSGPTDVLAGESPSVFTFLAALTGTGRFTTGFISVDVNGSNAVITEIAYERANGAFGQKMVSAPAAVTATEGGCADGRTLVQTRIVTTLENFGPVTIIETHCYSEP
jgi:hypothetical protein